MHGLCKVIVHIIVFRSPFRLKRYFAGRLIEVKKQKVVNFQQQKGDRGRLIEVSNTAVQRQKFWDFGKWPHYKGWPLYKGPTGLQFVEGNVV